MTVVAMVQTGRRQMELRDLERPEIGPDAALVRVEAVGICGSDVEFYEAPEAFFRGRAPAEYPVIRGHEPVGVIEEIGDVAAAERGLEPGDRVAIDPFIPCGICQGCLAGNSVLCTGWAGRTHTYGSIPLSRPPGLWGGFATHLYVHPLTVLHKVPPSVGPELATLYNALGAGFRWGVDLAEVTFGSTVAVLGCGQRGLCCTIAAKAAGASLVVVTGLSSDRHKLDLALELGADVAIDVEQEDAVARIKELTDGAGVDAVVEASSRSTGPVIDAIEVARNGGRVVLGGLKAKEVPSFPVDLVVRKSLTMVGVRGIHSSAYKRALDLIGSATLPLDRLRTHVFPLDKADHAIQVLAGELEDERPINIVVTP